MKQKHKKGGHLKGVGNIPTCPLPNIIFSAYKGNLSRTESEARSDFVTNYLIIDDILKWLESMTISY